MPRALEILYVTGDPAQSIGLRIRIPTAKNESYPQVRQEFSEVKITLSENYPFPPGPEVFFETDIFNPNVYHPSKRWCFGDWKITENLELFVTRLMKVIALDPTIINPRSAANGAAASWFVMNQKLHPELFPTISLSSLMMSVTKPTIVWKAIK
jgi:ubiquitin-protein ligase